MKGFAWRTSAIGFFSLAFLLPFQNCGKLSSLQGGENSASSHSAPHIMRTSSVESLNTDINFRVFDEKLSASALFNWTFKLDNVSSGCAPKTASNASTFVLNCSAPGSLKVTVEITDAGVSQSLTYATILQAPANGNEIPLEVVFEIPNGTGDASWNTAAARVEVFVGQKLKLKNMDSGNHQLHTGGRPCPHGNAIAPGATVDCVVSQSYNPTTNGRVYDHDDGTNAIFNVIAYDGAALYAQNCASCHTALASSTVRMAKVSQILAARSSKPAMMQVAGLQALTRRQIEAISYALGGR